MSRTFITVLVLDEDVADEYGKRNNYGEISPGEFLEIEMRRLEESGVSLNDWALVDDDIKWERYLMYLADWAISHNSEEYEGMSPESYNELSNKLLI